MSAIGPLGSRWTLEERITGLLKSGRDTMTQTNRRTVVLTAALLGAMCWLVGGVRAVDEPQTKSDTKRPRGAAEVVSDVQVKPVASGSDETPAGEKETKGEAAEDQFEFRFQVVTIKGEPVAGAKVTPSDIFSRVTGWRIYEWLAEIGATEFFLRAMDAT